MKEQQLKDSEAKARKAQAAKDLVRLAAAMVQLDVVPPVVVQPAIVPRDVMLLVVVDVVR